MKKFKIPVVPKSVTKSIRFPSKLIEEVNEAIHEIGRASCRERVYVLV